MADLENSKFVENAMKTLNLGENGHYQYTNEGLGDNLLALFDNLVREVKEVKIYDLITNILNEARTSKNTELIVNLFVIVMQTRWCRW